MTIQLVIYLLALILFGMASIKSAYGTNNQSITCTITSLTNTSARQSTAIDNTSALFLDALVFVKIKTASASTSASGFVTIFAYGTVDGGTTYSDGVTGTDGALTPTSPPNLVKIGVINAVANSTTYEAGPFSVAAAFGGVLPDHWGIVVQNQTGATLDASVGAAIYQGVYSTVA
jgi:hypothetical protein